MQMPNFDRRQFVAGAGAALASLGLPRTAAARQEAPAAAAPSAKKTALILGGTGFLGPHVVRTCLARGIEVTLFNRGRSNADLFPELETLLGDRDPKKGEGLKALEGDRTWDFVVDTSSYVPRVTKASCELLKDRTRHYTMVSTVSVYPEVEDAVIDESTAVGRLTDPTVETMGQYFENYGPLKALCEEAAEAVMPGRVFNVRPGLIVGPGDPTHRFTYWPVRIREGGEILAPGNVDDPVQIIDARDLAEFIVHAALENLTGVYNAVGPAHGETIAGMLYGCRAVTKSDARFTWVPMTGVQELGLSPWGDLPVWTGGASMDRVNGSKAWNAGLTSRTMADIASATLESWDAMTPEERARPYGMSRERETEALAAWHAKK